MHFASPNAPDEPLVDTEQRIRSAQLSLAFERLKASALLSIGVACLFCVLLWPEFPHAPLGGWLVGIVSVALARLGLWHWHRRSRPPPSAMRRWEWLFVAGVAAAAATWSAGALALLPHAEGYASAVLLVTLLCVASVAAASLAMHFVSYVTFMALTLLPTAGWLALQPGAARIVALAMFAGFVALVVTGLLAWRAGTQLLRTDLALSRALLDAADAQNAAEQANRAKSRFLANMSHEIRTPLNGVLGMTELLGTSRLDVTQQRYVQLLGQSAQHLLGLVNDVLDIAKIEAGRMQLERRPFDARALTAEAIDMFVPAAEQKNLRLEFEVDADVATIVRGDAMRLRQVLVNLISNAIKCTDAGAIRVHVRAEWTTHEYTLLHFSVHDSGCGIAPDALERIFSAFTQVDDSATRRIGGTGLGLTIARDLVAMMGGRIGVESQVGNGSTFWFTVELARAQPGDTVDRDAAAPHRDGASIPPCKVLVVEDNAVNRELMVAMLAKLGQRAEFAHDGEQALERLASESFDLVFMDVQLPGIDGMEATRRIRAAGHLAASGGALPVIALTANAFVADRRDATAAGMDDFVAKPVRIDAIGAVLAKWAPADAARAANERRIRYDRTHEPEETESGSRSRGAARADVEPRAGGDRGTGY
jgi:signal transduction histidine kinase/DNA-binding NarL/FixJ family response regulator